MLSCIYTFPIKNNKMWKENMNTLTRIFIFLPFIDLKILLFNMFLKGALKFSY